MYTIKVDLIKEDLTKFKEGRLKLKQSLGQC